MEWLKLMAGILLIGLSIPTALAEETAPGTQAASLAIFLAPHEIEHPVQLRDKWFGRYWINRGEIVLAVAKNSFHPLFREVSTCDGTNTADVITWIKPQLFFNPQMNVYYAKLKVNFYRADGTHIGTLKSQAQRDGFVDVALYQNVYLLFDNAFSKIVDQFSKDTSMQEAIRQSMAAHMTPAPCAIVGLGTK